jgi:hypothetical protein
MGLHGMTYPDILRTNVGVSMLFNSEMTTPHILAESWQVQLRYL